MRMLTFAIQTILSLTICIGTSSSHSITAVPMLFWSSDAHLFSNSYSTSSSSSSSSSTTAMSFFPTFLSHVLLSETDMYTTTNEFGNENENENDGETVNVHQMMMMNPFLPAVFNQAQTEQMRVPLELMTVLILPTLRVDQVSQSKVLKQTMTLDGQSWAIMSEAVPISIKEDITEPHAILNADQVTDYFQSPVGQSVLNNGKTDLLVIRLPKVEALNEMDDMLASILSTITKGVNGDTAFVLTGLASSPLTNEDDDDTSRQLQSSATTPPPPSLAETFACPPGYLLSMSNPAKPFCFSHFVHMTPGILAGIFVAFFFLVTLLIGLNCLHSIQTPTRYALQGPPKGKEF